MSIEVINLTKNYGKQNAIDNISFSLKPGEIVGFLGPNGAGKSTTMKIITGFIAPTNGVVMVASNNVQQEPLLTKQITGYLPEHNPLYLDMFVKEFLHFTGKLYGLGGDQLKIGINDIIEKCGLTNEQGKKIGQLSKGYRQRVGLAQALLHDPQVLILDEPTTGLDPNQILEIRELIKKVSTNKTILFSTHIMQEVEALCNRVIIINKGKLISDTTLDELRKDGNSLEETFRRLTNQ